jgi:phosphonate dehydrogenase
MNERMLANSPISKTIVVSHRIFPETLAALAKIGKVSAPNPEQQFTES